MRERLCNLEKALSKKGSVFTDFFYGTTYPMIVALFALLSYFSNFALLGFFVFGVFACAALLLYRDLTPFTPPLMFVMLILRSYDAVINPFIFIIFGAVLFCLVAHFIIYPADIKKGKLYLSLILVSVALLISGIGSPFFKDYMRGFATAFATGPVILFVYFLFTCYICPPKTYNHKMRFCYLLTLLGVTLTVELLLHRYLIYLDSTSVSHIDLGWNNINGVGAILLATIPACWYVITRSKHIFSSLTALIVIYLGIVITNSDGCIGTALVFIPVLALFSIFKGDNFHKNVLAKTFLISLSIVMTIVCFALAKTDVKTVFDFLILKLSNDTNRTILYKEALQLFKAFPIFGVGQGYFNPEGWLATNGVIAYNFHSTLFHVLATAGIVGILVYVFYFVQRYRILTANNSAFNLFMFIAFTMYEMYAMIDTGEFNVMPALLIVTLLLINVERINEKGNDGALPLQIL